MEHMIVSICKMLMIIEGSFCIIFHKEYVLGADSIEPLQYMFW